MNARTRILRFIHTVLTELLHVERRLEPLFRRRWNRLFREPAAELIQYFINRQRKDEGLQLAEEKIDPDEEESLDKIIDLMADQMRGHFKPGGYERGGNTKTHGIVRATVTILDDLPEHFRRGFLPRRAVTRPMYAIPVPVRMCPRIFGMSVLPVWPSN